MMKFADLRIFNDDIHNVVHSILESGQFIKGKYTRRFADEWAKYCGAKYCVPVASGSAALIASLKALQTINEKATKVICPDYSFAATAFSIIEAGFTPVYCPVLENGLINQEVCLKLLEQYQKDVLCVMTVNLYGQQVQICEELKRQTFIIEDACQSHGLLIQGDLACYSFYPSKNLGAAGDAGAVVCNNFLFAKFIERYVNYGDEFSLNILIVLSLFANRIG